MGSSHVGSAPTYNWVEAHPPATALAPGGGDAGAALLWVDPSVTGRLLAGPGLPSDPEQDPTVTATTRAEVMSRRGRALALLRQQTTIWIRGHLRRPSRFCFISGNAYTPQGVTGFRKAVNSLLHVQSTAILEVSITRPNELPWIVTIYKPNAAK